MTGAATVTAACVQLSPGADRAANVAAAIQGTREATARGARFVLLPEYATLLHASGRVMREAALAEHADEGLAALRKAAAESRCWMLIGSLTIRMGEERIANRSYLVSDEGAVVATYDKLHMFDATLPTGRVVRESATYRPGERAVLAATPWGGLGLSICHDIRFPQLYRALAQNGAVMLAVPSAFTQPTGELHWHALLRARAIENGCYVLAPATCGVHPGEHRTYGHSLIVDPHGAIVADAGDEPGIVLADLDLREVAKARARIPSLTHDCTFVVESAGAEKGAASAAHPLS